MICAGHDGSTQVLRIIKMQRKLTRRHGGTERIILENTFSYRSQVARILQQLTFVEMEETFAVPLCRRVRPLSRDVTHLSVLATSANIPNTFATINRTTLALAAEVFLSFAPPRRNLLTVHSFLSRDDRE